MSVFSSDFDTDKLVSSNGRVLLASQGFINKWNCINAFKLKMYLICMNILTRQEKGAVEIEH